MSKKKKDQEKVEQEQQAQDQPLDERPAQEAAPETPETPEAAAEAAEETGDEGAADEVEAEDRVEPELTAEELLARERDEFKEKWMRVVAELDNVRKRSRRELADGRRFARADVLRGFLEVQDNFERALQSMGDSEDTENKDSVREGVELIFQNFRRVLKDQGVEPIESLDQEFDPAVHEAVGQFAREGVEPGVVIEVVQQGFRLGEMVLRPSRVIISS
jgi:molecular chaperone GrpE